MKVFAISIVRNEADVIRASILHGLSLSLDGWLIIDNGSTDGTTDVLAKLGRRTLIQWHRDESPFHAASMLTALAREAMSAGADWVFEIDADEFWHAPGGNFKGVLERATATKLRVRLINFIQARTQLEARPEGLLTMSYRSAVVCPPDTSQELVTRREVAYVEAEIPTKLVSRTSPEIVIGKGSHFVLNVDGPEVATDEIICLHAPLRARSVLEQKAGKGRRVEEAGFEGGESWHLRRWRELQDEGKLDQEWAANSYAAGGVLNAFGGTRQLIHDPRLRDLAARWLQPSLTDRVQRWWSRLRG